MNRLTKGATLAVAIATIPLLAGCGSDDTNSDDPTAAADTTAPTGDSSGDVLAAIDDNAEIATLTLSMNTPPDATVVVDSGAPDEDRTVRRGGQSEHELGQTFTVDDTTSLTGVSFLVAAPATVPAGQPFELGLYEVGNTATMVPSAPITIGEGTDRLVLPLPDPIEPGDPVHLVYTFDAVELPAGSYAVVLAVGNGGPPTELFLQHADGDALPGGLPINLEGTGWQADTVNGDNAITLTFEG